MLAGDYHSAIPVLRRAVAAAPPDSLTYAYALFDLGRSLRLAGDPRAAVPILWRRLHIPNQTPVVRAELTLALRALGQQAASASGSGPGDHHGGGAAANQGD
jgi:Flp pilus assembly protein TadD